MATKRKHESNNDLTDTDMDDQSEQSDDSGSDSSEAEDKVSIVQNSTTSTTSTTATTSTTSKTKQHPIIQSMYEALNSMKSKLMLDKFKSAYKNPPRGVLTIIRDNKMMNTEWHNQGYCLFVIEIDITRSTPKGDQLIPLSELKAIDKRNPFKITVVPLKPSTNHTKDSDREWCPGWILPPKEFFQLHAPKATEKEYAVGPLTLSRLAKVSYSPCPNFYEQRFYFFNPQTSEYNIRLETIVPKELRCGISKADANSYRSHVERYKQTALEFSDSECRKRKTKRLKLDKINNDKSEHAEDDSDSINTTSALASVKSPTPDQESHNDKELQRMKALVGISGDVSALANLNQFDVRPGIFARFHVTENSSNANQLEREYQDQIKHIESLTSRIRYELQQQTAFCFLLRDAKVLEHSITMREKLKQQYQQALSS